MATPAGWRSRKSTGAPAGPCAADRPIPVASRDMSTDALHPDTIAILAGRGAHAPGSPINVPPVLSTVYREGGPTEYVREGNPTWEALEEAVGALEGGRAVTFASGLAAVAAVLDSLPVGGRVVLPRTGYQGLRALVADLAGRGRLDALPVDITDTEEVLAAAEGAALLWIESPTNPLLEVAEVPVLIERARDLGTPVAVDATFATPLCLRPLDLGADLVVHSGTKLLSGHSDVLLGVVATRDDGWHERIVTRRVLHGAVPGPVEAYLALRGLRTLPLRLERAQANALELARRLVGHPAVARVRHPGLPEDAWHERARAHLGGFGTIVSFELADADVADAACRTTRVIEHVTSLGGVESTMERRGRYPDEAHLPPGLIRLSVGCEHVEDLWSDLVQALPA
jgi:cystathionine gamma-synthase